VVDLDARTLSVPGVIALEEGWLEVVACMAGTREHEAIFVTPVKPSVVHAALLLMGAVPGSPAQYDRTTGRTIPAKGEFLEVALEWDQQDGSTHHVQVAELLDADRELDAPLFVFSGSMIVPNSASMGPGEHYVADYAGNIVGLATFGDEVVAMAEVHSPETATEPEAWRIKSGSLPRAGTHVRLILRLPG